MPKIVVPAIQTEPAALHPILGVALGEYEYSVLGKAGGLSQFCLLYTSDAADE